MLHFIGIFYHSVPTEYINLIGKSKVTPLQARCGPEGG